MSAVIPGSAEHNHVNSGMYLSRGFCRELRLVVFSPDWDTLHSREVTVPSIPCDNLIVEVLVVVDYYECWHLVWEEEH